MEVYSAVPLPLKASPALRQRGQAVRDRKIIWVGHNPWQHFASRYEGVQQTKPSTRKDISMESREV